tara:strand:- start:92 stop:235 length:144 start_codon:yes stop_codon:yes gene_type:complete
LASAAAVAVARQGLAVVMVKVVAREKVRLAVTGAAVGAVKVVVVAAG